MGIFNSLFSLLKTGAFFVILNDYLRRTFPEKYEEILISFSLKIIYLYSQGQIYLIQIQNYINNAFETNNYLKIIKNEFKGMVNYQEKQYEICQMNELGNFYCKKFLNLSDIPSYLNFKENEKSIFVFYDNKNPNNNCVNHVVLQSQPFSLDYQVSNIKFLMIELKIGDKSYKIDLKTENYNYYIVNNILDKKFFNYYLRIHKILNSSDALYRELEQFNIKIIDHNINLKELEISNKKFIVIKKDDYIYG